MSGILKLISPGVVTGENLQKLFKIAKEKNFAIPAVNCIGTDSINAALEAAAKVSSPIIIQFSCSGSEFISGKGLKLNNYKSSVLGAISGAIHVHNVSKLYGIPVILHTDHCSKSLLPWLDQLLEVNRKHYLMTGKPLFSSHMVDLSTETLEENIKISSKYLKIVSDLGMTLEIELGCTGGEEDGIDNTKLDKSVFYTKPEDVEYAYKILSKISNRFIIAATFGNVHGVYKPGRVCLNPQILLDSQKYVSTKWGLETNPLNFVFHGGSGTKLEDIQKAISYGVVKINIDTDVQWATWKGILKYYKKNSNFLQSQLVDDKPNKKFYSPREWIRSSQLEMINFLEKFFKKINAVNIL